MKIMYDALHKLYEMCDFCYDASENEVPKELEHLIYSDVFINLSRYIDRQEIKHQCKLLFQDDEFVYTADGLSINKYRKVKREAKKDELIIITTTNSLFYEDGLNEIYIVEDVHEPHVFKGHVEVFKTAIYHNQYEVLELLDVKDVLF